MTVAISPLLNFIYALSLNESGCREACRVCFDLLDGTRDHIPTGLFQTRFQRSVENGVTDPDHDARDQRRIDLYVEQRFAIDRPTDAIHDFFPQGIIQLCRNANLNLGAATAFDVQLFDIAHYVPQKIEPTVARKHFQEVEDRRACELSKYPVEDL